MPLRYDPPQPDDSPLIQGEILSNLNELRAEHPASKPSAARTPFRPVPHRRAVVLTNICDLAQDHKARKEDAALETVSEEVEPSEPEPEDIETAQEKQEPPENLQYIPYVFFCELMDAEQMLRRPDVQNVKVLRRLSKNNDMRLHYLPAAPVGPDAAGVQLPDLYVDFRKTFALPTETVYAAIVSEAVTRDAIIPVIYIHDLVQRQHAYLSRVGLPD